MLTSLTAGRTFAFDPFASCDNGACKQKVSASSLDQNNCRSGDVLEGAENKKDLKILSKCETARGKVHDVHHHMKDGDYKFGLDVQKKYKDLLNKGNNKKRVGGNLIVEVVLRTESQVTSLYRRTAIMFRYGALGLKTNLTAGMRFIRLGRWFRSK